MRLQLVASARQADFLDLPWHTPLADWSSDRVVDVPMGLSRHVVRFVFAAGQLYGLKELPLATAEREYGLLRALAERSIPAVEAIGVVSQRSRSRSAPDADDPLEAVLITRHLDYSLPYRSLFTGHGVPDLRNHLLDALAHLLVRLHLTGFFWGDCSLSNTLFRRDAGALAAYLVDAETGELHPELTDGQRNHDLLVAEENIAGDLMDVQAADDLPADLDPIDTAADVVQRYGALWSELTHREVFALDERYRIDARIRRLNELGFDVEELELVAADDAYRLELQPLVVEPGHHRRRLLALTGLNVQENQARRLRADISGFGAHLGQVEGRALSESVVAYRWLSEVFEPTLAAIPVELRGRLDAPEIFHQVLEHRWFLSEANGRDVGMQQAVRSYVDDILRHQPDERSLLAAEPSEPPAPGERAPRRV